MLITIASNQDLRSEEDISHSQETCKTIRTSLYANPTYEKMIKSMGLDPVVVPLNSSISTELKLWTVAKGKLNCVKTLQLFPSTDPEYISSMCVDEESELIIIGTVSGKVFAIRGDLGRMKNCKAISLTSSPYSAITNLHILPSDVSVNAYGKYNYCNNNYNLLSYHIHFLHNLICITHRPQTNVTSTLPPPLKLFALPSISRLLCQPPQLPLSTLIMALYLVVALHPSKGNCWLEMMKAWFVLVVLIILEITHLLAENRPCVVSRIVCWCVQRMTGSK